TDLVLDCGRLSGILAKGYETANASSASRRDVVTSRAVTVLASLFLSFISGIEQKNSPHYRLGKFFKLGRVASLANFAADVRGGPGFGRFGFGRPDRRHVTKQEK